LEDFTSIQAAVDAASVSDTILVRPGTYYESVKFNQTKSGILLKGDGPVAGVVIDADTLVVGFWSTDPAVRVENLTLTGGDVHGALWVQGAKVELIDCVIRDNVGPGNCNGVGGGGQIIFFSDVLVEGCVFEGNHSWEAPGGLIVWGSRADIRNNIFRNNSSCYGGGTMSTPGAAGCSMSTARRSFATTPLLETAASTVPRYGCWAASQTSTTTSS
jgi:hypothetical protein